jgi:hypothetical protein
MPWLAHLDKMEGFKNQLRREAVSSADVEATADKVVALVDEEVLLSCLADLEAERAAESVAAIAMETIDFRTTIRAGTEALELKGEYSDASQGKAVSLGAKEWCERHRLQKTYKATYTEHGDTATCKVLVRSWCHRMQFFYNMELRQGDTAFVFTLAHVREYVEPSEFTALASRVKKKSTMMRIDLVRSIPLKD